MSKSLYLTTGGIYFELIDFPNGLDENFKKFQLVKAPKEKKQIKIFYNAYFSKLKPKKVKFKCNNYLITYENSVYSLFSTLESNTHIADIDLNSLEACFYKTIQKPWNIYPFSYPFDEISMMHFFCKYSRILIHGACGAVNKNKGFLFAGESGSGKTTFNSMMINLKPNYKVLSDDRTILYISKSEKHKCFGSPFGGIKERNQKEGTKLKAVFILKKSNKVFIEEISKSEAFKKLISCSFYPRYSITETKIALELLGKIVLSVPCFYLNFPKDEKYGKNILDILENLS